LGSSVSSGVNLAGILEDKRAYPEGLVGERRGVRRGLGPLPIKKLKMEFLT